MEIIRVRIDDDHILEEYVGTGLVVVKSTAGLEKLVIDPDFWDKDRDRANLHAHLTNRYYTESHYRSRTYSYDQITRLRAKYICMLFMEGYLATQRHIRHHFETDHAY
jgi:hypothetical protein